MVGIIRAVVAPLPPDHDRLAAIREALPAVGAGIYLNTAAAGPLPAETARAMAEEAAREATLGRAHPADAEETLERVAEARAAVAAVLAADLENVALTRGIRHGLDLAIAAVQWRPGDRAVFLGDPGGDGIWPAARLRGLGVEVIDVEVQDSSEVVEAVEEAASSGARMVGVPHVLGTTGAVLPVARVADVARQAGAILAVDGSYSVGSIPVSPDELGAEVLAFPVERWLLGPAGLGGWWCSEQLLEGAHALHRSGFADPLDARDHSEAMRTSASVAASGWHRPSVVGMARSCGWLSMQVGLTWAWERTATLARHAAIALGNVAGVELLRALDAGQVSGIVSFRIKGWESGHALDELGARVFAIAGHIESLDAIRVSVGAWNTEDEIDRFVEAVALLAAHTPATMPPRRTLAVLE
jgi:selenocysteine lyase/cysteine desulfurase